MNICEFFYLNFNLKWIYCVSRGEGRADRVYGSGVYAVVLRFTVDRVYVVCVGRRRGFYALVVFKGAGG